MFESLPPQGMEKPWVLVLFFYHLEETSAHTPVYMHGFPRQKPEFMELSLAPKCQALTHALQVKHNVAPQI